FVLVGEMVFKLRNSLGPFLTGRPPGRFIAQLGIELCQLFSQLLRFQPEFRSLPIPVGDALAGNRKLEFEFPLGPLGHLTNSASHGEPNNDAPQDATCNQCDDDGGIVHGACLVKNARRRRVPPLPRLAGRRLRRSNKPESPAQNISGTLLSFCPIRQGWLSRRWFKGRGESQFPV